ncbi:MAG: hypothetical protein HY028_08060 [Gammaproteobacteria bacterium]|nr:hypothetical protein [Gammaproteobacteria bacterium]
MKKSLTLESGLNQAFNLADIGIPRITGEHSLTPGPAHGGSAVFMVLFQFSFKTTKKTIHRRGRGEKTNLFDVIPLHP